MIKAFVFIVFCFLFSLPARAQTADQPLPEASFKVNLPHTKRTKDNVADALLDFLLTRAFAKLENVTVAYDFFELQPEGVLKFTNFSIQIKRPTVTGGLVFSTLTVGAKELLGFLETKAVLLGKVSVHNVAADLAVGEEQKKVSFKAKDIDITQAQVMVFKKERGKDPNEAILIRNAVVSGAAFVDGRKRYQAGSVTADGIKIRIKKPYGISFDKAVADGKTYTDFNDLSKALMK